MRIGRTSCSPIGLDLGSRFIKAAQVTGAPQQPRLTAVMSIERADIGAAWSAAEVQRVLSVLHRRGFEGKQVVVAAPTSACMTGVLTLPPAQSGAPLSEIAAAEMGRMHRCEVAPGQVALWPLPQPARRVEGEPYMAAACQVEHAEPMLDALQDAGLDVIAMDIEGWAMGRAARAHLLRATGTSAVLAIGWQAATLALMHGTTLVYKRILSSAGLADVIQSAQREHHLDTSAIEYLFTAIGLDHEAAQQSDSPAVADRIIGPLAAHFDQVTQELSLSVAYASHEYPDAPVEQLLVAGGGARIPGLSGMLAQRLELDVRIVRPTDVCDVSPSMADEARAPELTIATGLALYREEEAA